MSIRAHFYSDAPVFHGLERSESGTIVGYASIIDKLNFNIPVHKPVALICDQNKSFENEDWRVFQPSYLPEDHERLSKIEALYKHLVFSLKYEGVNLLMFSALTRYFSEEELYELTSIEPTGEYGFCWSGLWKKRFLKRKH